jgi:hypothetical protein
MDALLGVAMFNGCKPEEYFLARDALGEFTILCLHVLVVAGSSPSFRATS